MTALKYVAPTQINPVVLAAQLRDAADILALGTWEAIFVGESRAFSAALALHHFCRAADAAGTAPNFLDALDAVAALRS